MTRRRDPNPGAGAPSAPLPATTVAPTPNRPLRLAYFRVSTTDQSIEAQRAELAGGPFDREFIDEGVSGASLMAQRPGFGELLAQAREGDTLYVAAVDRLGRDAIDVQATVRKLLLAGVLIDIKGLGLIGRGVGELIIAVLAQVADMERRRIMDRSKAGLAAARASLEATGKTHRGKDSLGRPPAADAESVVAWRKLGDRSIAETARHFDISEATVKRYCAATKPGKRAA
jgi:putative DNA-invertase from lambdoid prophage Rac